MGKIELPIIPANENDEDESYLITQTSDLHLISQYTLLPFDKVLELDCVTYRLLFKDAFINMMSKSEEGRDSLEQAYLLTQTNPNRKKLREQFNKGD